MSMRPMIQLATLDREGNLLLYVAIFDIYGANDNMLFLVVMIQCVNAVDRYLFR